MNWEIATPIAVSTLFIGWIIATGIDDLRKSIGNSSRSISRDLDKLNDHVQQIAWRVETIEARVLHATRDREHSWWAAAEKNDKNDE